MFVALYDVMSTVGIAANVRCLPRWLHSCSWQGWLLENYAPLAAIRWRNLNHIEK